MAIDTTKPIVEFLNTIKSCGYIFKDGTRANFINGVYRTSDEHEIAELNDAISKRNPYILSGREITAEELDPMIGVKRKIIDEYLAEQALLMAQSIDKSNDMGGNGLTQSFGALNSEGTINEAVDAASRLVVKPAVITPVKAEPELVNLTAPTIQGTATATTQPINLIKV